MLFTFVLSELIPGYVVDDSQCIECNGGPDFDRNISQARSSLSLRLAGLDLKSSGGKFIDHQCISRRDQAIIIDIALNRKLFQNVVGEISSSRLLSLEV